MGHFLKIFFVFLLCFSSCSQFQSIFDGQAESSYGAASKNKKSQKTRTAKKRKKKKDIAHSSDEEGGVRKPIVTKRGTYYFVQPGDTLIRISKKYKFSREDLAQINDLYDSKLVIGRRLFIPNKRTKRDFISVTNVIKDKKLKQEQESGKLNFAWPVKKFVLTSKFGWRRGRPHDGIDLSAKRGTPIYAAAAGKVIFSKRFSGYGNLVVIKHAKNYFSAYAHANAVYVTVGKKVNKGDKIAAIGTTGRSSGPHLHFEIHKKTRAIDPLTLLPSRR